MGWPESVTYLLLVVLGYALTRIIDLAVDWQRNRLRLRSGDVAGNDHLSSPATRLSATARQRLMERRAVYARFRTSVNNAVEASVNQGGGNYGMLYQIRDDYGDLLRNAPTSITQAADSLIRCVTLLVNLGPSDQRYAMFTRALKLFDEECDCDQGLKVMTPAPHHREFSVLSGDVAASMTTRMPDAPATPGARPTEPAASPTEIDSGSVRAPT
ncbi:MAG: hypothetical protein ABL989_12690 [Gammaproteobacteria bacterium]